MAAYMLVDVQVHDPVRYQAYMAAVPRLIARHGGEYLVRGGAAEVLEGPREPGRLVVFRFPNRQAIHDFVNDPEYQPLKALRQSVATASIVAVDGVDG
jgi:uncharacterized protein (DUF1330 family)